MELAGGEPPFPATPGGPRYRWVQGDDSDIHPALSDSTDTIISSVGNHHAGYTPQRACGGAPCTSESGGPCGSPSRPVVSEIDACRPSPPCQPLTTLRRDGVGTNNNILHVVSGGNPGGDLIPGSV